MSILVITDLDSRTRVLIASEEKTKSRIRFFCKSVRRTLSRRDSSICEEEGESSRQDSSSDRIQSICGKLKSPKSAQGYQAF